MIGPTVSYSQSVLRTLHDMTKLMDVTGAGQKSLLEQQQEQYQMQNLMGTANTLASFTGDDPASLLKQLGLEPSAVSTSGLFGNTQATPTANTNATNASDPTSLLQRLGINATDLAASGLSTNTQPTATPPAPQPIQQDLPSFETWDSLMNWFDGA